MGLAQAEAANPDRLPANPCAANLDLCAGDPRLYDWGNRYGIERPVHFANRNGAVISGHLWAPLPRKHERIKRLPTVVFVVGDLASEEIYWYAAQAIARSGYVVMTFDPQGHGASDTYGAGDDRMRHVEIQQTAGGGASEAAADEDAVEQTRDAMRFFGSRHRHRYLPVRTPDHPKPGTSPGRRKQRALAKSGDADRSNPLRRLMDPSQMGIAGHSRGADVASILGARDRRVDAIVAFDNLMATTSPDADGHTKPLHPRVPALGMSADYYEAPQPYTSDPPPLDKDQGYAAYRRAGEDAMEVIVRGGTHFEWSYAPGLPATLRGIDMATWYAQAWFDRYLKHKQSADRRLLSDRWRHDPQEKAVDVRGDPNLYSFYYRSKVAVHRQGHLVRCGDLRKGCPDLVPKRRDGYPGEYSYLRAEQG
jgi:pimeloyl-ACP methyl ester carboxylesterase